MIGRGAVYRPWLFHEILRLLFTMWGSRPAIDTTREKHLLTGKEIVS